MSYMICKKLTFEASHRLWNDNLSEEKNYEIFGKCSNSPNHGHSYKLFVYLKSDILKNGMVLNFADVKKIVSELIIDKFDHHFLNDFFPHDLTTAEFLSKYIFAKIKPTLPQLQKIRLWETETSYAEWEIER